MLANLGKNVQTTKFFSDYFFGVKELKELTPYFKFKRNPKLRLKFQGLSL